MSAIKRITYLEKRDDLSAAEFSRHWRTTHAEIAIDLPSVLSYRQNHVRSIIAQPTDGIPYPVDGIVELWFGDDDGFGAGYGSDVATRLTNDEPNFLQGMVGSAVRSGAPTPNTRNKVWVLARGTEVELSDVAARITSIANAEFVQMNYIETTRPLLVRERLRADPEPPEIALSLGFTSEEAAAAAAEKIAVVTASSGLRRIQVLTVDEVTII